METAQLRSLLKMPNTPLFRADNWDIVQEPASTYADSMLVCINGVENHRVGFAVPTRKVMAELGRTSQSVSIRYLADGRQVGIFEAVKKPKF